MLSVSCSYKNQKIPLICCLKLISFLAGRENLPILIFLLSSLSCPMEERTYCSGCHRSNNCHLGTWGQMLFFEESQGWAHSFHSERLPSPGRWLRCEGLQLHGGHALPRWGLRRCNWWQLFFSLGYHLGKQRSWLWCFYCPWICLGKNESDWSPSWATWKWSFQREVPSMSGQKKPFLWIWPH